MIGNCFSRRCLVLNGLVKIAIRLIVAASLLTAQAMATTDEPITLRLWFNGVPESDGKVLEELIPLFEAQHPNITVDWEITSWNTYQRRIAVAAAGGTLPDIITGFSNLVAGFADRDLMVDHSLYFDREAFVPATLDLTSWDGRWAMLPSWFSVNALSYRADLMREAGLDADHPPETWQALLTWAKETTESDSQGISRLGFYSSAFSFNRTNLFQMLVEANGGQMFSDDGWNVAFNSPQGIEAAAFFQQLVQCCDRRGAIELDNIGLGQGRTAMTYNNFAFHNWQQDFPELVEQGRLFSVPAGPSGSPELRGVGLGANVIGITRQSEHPEAAAKLLRFLIKDPDNIALLASFSGGIPAVRFDRSHPYFETNPWVGRYLELANQAGVPEPAHPRFGEYNQTLAVWLDELLYNGMNPEHMVEAAAAEIQAEIIDRSGVPFFTGVR